MIDTVDTDVSTPMRSADEPKGEWLYRAWVDHTLARGGIAQMSAWLVKAGERASFTYNRHIEYRTLPTFPAAMSVERTVDAYVNWSRWMVDCPCGGAQVISPDDPRFFCIHCFNGGDGWWPVVWPEPAERAAIETLLNRRPDPHTRNWQPGESVEQLQGENLQHGIDAEVDGYIWPGAAQALVLVRERLGLPEGSYVPQLTQMAERDEQPRAIEEGEA